MKLFHARQLTEARVSLSAGRGRRGTRRGAARAAAHRDVRPPPGADAKVSFGTAEEYYNYGVALINARNFAEARTHLEKALAIAPGSDHIHYALALAQALLGRFRERARESAARDRTGAAQSDDGAPGCGFRAAGESIAVPFPAVSGKERAIVVRALCRRIRARGRPVSTPGSRHRRRHGPVQRAAGPEALRAPHRPRDAHAGHHGHRHGDRRWRQLRAPAPRIRRASAGRYPQLHGGAERRFGAALAAVPVPLPIGPRA